MKKTLAVYQTITSGDMSGDLTSPATNIEFLDNIGFQLNWTGTPTGVFSVEVSADHKEQNGVVSVAGNWVALTLSTTIAAAGAADSAYIDITQISAPWIRVIYTSTSGTGSLNAFVVAKEV